MKKIFFVVMAVFGLAANAQGQFNVGLNVGLPLENKGEPKSFALLAEVNYLFEISDEFKIGPSVAYNVLFGRDTSIGTGFTGQKATVEGEIVNFLPLAVAGRFNPSEDFILGADLGYGVTLDKEEEGGFYYRPLVAYKIADNIALQFSYSGIIIADKDVEIAGKKLTVRKGKNNSVLSLGATFSF